MTIKESASWLLNGAKLGMEASLEMLNGTVLGELKKKNWDVNSRRTRLSTISTGFVMAGLMLLAICASVVSLVMLPMAVVWAIAKPRVSVKRSKREVNFVRPPQVNAHVEGEVYELDLNKGDEVSKTYPVYPRDSQKALEFRSHFATARAVGLKTFWWEGREYTTELKEEKK